MDGRLAYKRAWMIEEREMGMTSLSKTTEVLQGMMNSICSWLVRTIETEDMFAEKKLPTLDVKIWVTAEQNINIILFMFFEKKMVSPMVLHKRSAMPEGIRRATLNQEMIRRMVNTSEMVPLADRLMVIVDYTQKLINSEYSVDESRDIVVGGLKGYERLLSLSKDIGNPRWKRVWR